MIPDPVYVTDDIEVQDAYIKFSNGSFKSGDQLCVVVEEFPDFETSYPVPADEDGRIWYTSNDHGVWWGFKNGKVGVPANEKPITTTFEVEHEALGTEDRVPHLSHHVQSVVNDEYEPAVQVSFQRESYSVRTIAVSLSKAKEIVNAYVNGPFGADPITRYRHKRRVQGKRNWGSATHTDEDRLELVESEATIEFTEDRIRDWVPTPVIESEPTTT